MPNDDPGPLQAPPRVRVRRRRWRLQAVDVLLLAAIVLPALSFVAVAAYDRNQTLMAAERDLLSTLDTLHGHAENVFQFQALALGAADEWVRGRGDAQLRGDAAAGHAYLSALRHHSGQALGVMVFAADGRPLLDSHRTDVSSGLNVSDRSYFRWHQANASPLPHVAAPVRSRVTGSPLVFITLRRSSSDGAFVGVIGAGIRQETLIDFWDRATPGPSASVTLLRDDGVILARRPALDPEERTAIPPDSTLARAIASGTNRVVLAVNPAFDGVDRLFAIRRLDRFDIIIAHSVSRAEVLAPWRTRVAFYGVFALAVSVALFSLALLAKRGARDLHALNESLEQRVKTRTADIEAGEARVRLLAREVDHRAKNVLAVVQATLRLTPRDDAQAYAKAVEGRVSALALAQNLLSRDRWTGASLRALLESELAPFAARGDDGQGPRATLDGPAVILPPLITQPLAMAVHELSTNAVKHGALSVPGGLVTITWRQEARAGGQTLVLRWVETGGPMVPGQPGRGFGSRVLDAVVRGQMEGGLSSAWERTGLVCEIVVPLGRAGDAVGEAA